MLTIIETDQRFNIKACCTKFKEKDKKLKQIWQLNSINRGKISIMLNITKICKSIT